MRKADHLEFGIITRSGFFEILAESSVDYSDGGKILCSAESEVSELLEEGGDVAEGVGGADAGEDARVFGYGEDLGGLGCVGLAVGLGLR